METPADVRPQGIFHVLVGEHNVKPVRIEVTAAPSFHIGVLRIVPVGHDGQEPLVAVNTANIFRRTRTSAGNAGTDLGRNVQSERFSDLDDMTPAVAEVVKVAEHYPAASVEIEKAYLVLVKGTRAARETILVQKLGIAIPQAANVEFVQVAVPPVEGGLDRKMELPQMPDPRDDKLSPDCRLEIGQCDPDLQRIGISVEHGIV